MTSATPKQRAGEHTPCPWYVMEKPAPSHADHGHRGMAYCGKWMVAAPYEVAFKTWDNEANARRIVACVNACEGYPAEFLERGGLRSGIKGGAQAEDALREREMQLAEALRAVLRSVPFHHSHLELKARIEALLRSNGR